MIVTGKSADVKAIDLHDGKSVLHAEKRVLIGKNQGAKNFAMRRFTLGEGGCSPRHTHPYEHEVYVLAGKGAVRSDGAEVRLALGDYVFVPPSDDHQFVNAGKEPFEFICVVPAGVEE